MVETKKKTFFAANFFAFLSFFALQCAAPKRWWKYETRMNQFDEARELFYSSNNSDNEEYNC